MIVLVPVIAAVAGGLMSFIGISLVEKKAASSSQNDAAAQQAIDDAQRQAIINKPPGTLTAADIANLHANFTTQQAAVVNSLGTPGLVKPSEISAVDQAGAVREGMSAEQFVQSMGGPSDKPRAMVTTSDPSPSGDLRVLDSPSTSGNKIGGAPKGGIVTVMNMDASPDFAEIIWGGGWGFPAVVQYPGVRGFVKKKFLVIQ